MLVIIFRKGTVEERDVCQKLKKGLEMGLDSYATDGKLVCNLLMVGHL
jgi:hypothetical protein